MKYQAGANYFTDDPVDAKGTAKFMRKNAVPSDKTTPEAKAEQEDYDNMED